MNKKGFSTLAIVLIVLAVTAVIGTAYYFQSNGGITSADGFLKIRLYDANGNIINPSTSTLSVVNGAKGVAYMDLTVKVNNGATSVPLSCDIYSATVNGASGTPFDSALTRGSKYVPVSGTAEWTSNQFSPSQFEGAPTPDVFNVTVRCQYSDISGQHNLDQSGASPPITILPDGTGSFTVQLNNPGGIPAKYCGDLICDATLGETATTCPQDCASQNNVTFRATDLSYVYGSAIGFSPTCGLALTKYGFDSYSCTALTDSICPVITGYTRQLASSTIPDSIATWSTISPCFYTTSSGLSMLFKVTNTNGEPTICAQSKWLEIRYTTASSFASSVSSQITGFTSAKEIAC